MDSKIKVAQDFLDALRNQDRDRLSSLLSDDAHIVGASGTHYGKKELMEFFKHTGTPFIEGSQELIGEYLSGDTVLIETVGSAVHVDTYMGIPPSNKRVVMPAVNVFEVVGNKVKAWRQYQNFKILVDAHNR